MGGAPTRLVQRKLLVDPLAADHHRRNGETVAFRVQGDGSAKIGSAKRAETIGYINRTVNLSLATPGHGRDRPKREARLALIDQGLPRPLFYGGNDARFTAGKQPLTIMSYLVVGNAPFGQFIVWLQVREAFVSS